jgi:hypothetical protein
VHVLKRIHRWLRPRGRVLDIHPEPEPASVDVRTPIGIENVGPFERPALDEKIRAARTALSRMVVAGHFVPQRSVIFEVVSYHANVDAWLEYRARRNSTSPVDPALLDRAREMMIRLGGEELRVHERIRASRYGRRGSALPG